MRSLTSRPVQTPSLPPVRSLKAAAALGALAALVLAGGALAAAPLPQTAKAYSTGAGRHAASITLVISATDAKVIEPGSAVLGSQFALSGGSVSCPKAKRNKGFHEAPFAIFGFPGATLRLAHGRYGFSVSVKEPNAAALGSSGKTFTLKVKIKGTVASPSLITGTVKPAGGPCTSKKPLKFKAKLNDKIPVAPGQ